MIEVRGMLGAVEAADAALKAAPVSLLRAKRVRGGLVTVFLAGDVASVRSAVDAAVSSLGRLGRQCSTHVIPNLSQDVLRMLVEGEGACAERMEPSAAAPLLQTSPERREEPEDAADSGGTGDTLEGEGDDANGDELESMTVMELRSLARNAGIATMSKKQIRFAGKAELIREMTVFFRDRERVEPPRSGANEKRGESE
jgi:microcompartment protein CcmL/EutN